MTVAIAGNPNAGKTTLFNALTGANAKIGNYPGITVERRMGLLELPRAGLVELVDIPGTYSLTARSADEEVAIIELLGRKGFKRPDAAIVVLDATALERNLFLLMQVLEFEVPVIAAINMLDAAHKDCIEIDFESLQEIFQVPFIGVSARKRQGIGELKAALDHLLATGKPPVPERWLWHPPAVLEKDLNLLEPVLKRELDFLETPNRRRAFALWLLMSLRENVELQVAPVILDEARRVLRRIRKAGRDLDREVILKRYEFIDSRSVDYIRRPSEQCRTPSDRIDTVLTHPVWGFLIFMFIMGIIFQALFSWSDPFISLLEQGFGALSRWLEVILPAGFLRALLIDGIIAGVGAVVGFLPQILFLFLFISLLEGTGYLARAAFMIDGVMRRIGLHGQAFVPMLSGLACAVPAILATRTIESRRDRLLTLMVVPLMSCSARLPAYTLIIGAIFPATQQWGFISYGTMILLGIYVLSTVLALVAAGILGKTVFKGKPQPLLLELPPYRLPDLKSLGMTLWERSRVFLSTAGTIILVMTVILWVLLRFPGETPAEITGQMAQAQAAGDATRLEALQNEAQAARLENSYAGQLGTLIEPVIKPLGFDWKIGVGLIGAFAAREVFVSTMGVVYGIGDDGNEESTGLRQAMTDARRPDGRKVWTPLTGVSLMIFFMIAMQCMSTLAVVRSETKSWKWTFFLIAYLTGTAYIASLLVYQGGRLLGLA
ncbi:MAG: ferrous iron transport protein B [Acidobacteria bacterium]|nr:ferrous iron transport protein B [Acidobacteriota bacterium]